MVATGPFQMPFVPADRRGPRRRGRADAQHAPTARRRPSPTAACSSSAAATPAFRSPRSCRPRARSIWPIGSRQTPLPQRILGRDLFWYLDKTGLIRKIDGFPDRPADAEAGGHADRLESASRTSARRRAPRPSRRCRGIDGQLRRRQPTWTFAASSGQPASESITRGSTSRCSTRTAAPCTSAA